MRPLLLWPAGLLAVAAAASAQTQPPARLAVVEIRDLPLRDAVRLLSEETGINIVPSAAAAAVRVSLYLRDVPPMAAIEALCQSHGLWYKVDDATRIVRIHTVDEYRRDLASFREERIEVFTLLYPNARDAARAVRDLFGDRVVLGADDEDASIDDLRDRFERFDLIDGRSQGLGIFSGASAGSATNAASQTLRDSDRSNRRATTTAERRDRRLEELRSQPLEDLTPEEIQELEQALAEGGPAAEGEDLAAILRRRAANIYVSVIDSRNQMLVRTSDQETMVQIREVVQRIDVPTPMVLLEVKILSIELGDGFTSIFDFQFDDPRGADDFAGGFTTGDILTPAGESFLPRGTGIRSDALVFQYVGEQFRARMQLVEDENRVTVLATPMLLTPNNEVSRLFVGEERPLNRGFTGPQTLVSTGGVTTTVPGSTTIEFRPIGTTLLVTPNINADRTVTLRILQETSTIAEDSADVLVPTDTGFLEQTIDVVQARSVSGTVVAKDGLAVVFGGLIEEFASDRRQEVPILGKIPFLGFFFRRHETGRGRRELVIMVRPFVLQTAVEGQDVSRRLLDELSLHPVAPEGQGDLGLYGHQDVLRERPPHQKHLRESFRFLSIEREGF